MGRWLLPACPSPSASGSASEATPFLPSLMGSQPPTLSQSRQAGYPGVSPQAACWQHVEGCQGAQQTAQPMPSHWPVGADTSHAAQHLGSVLPDLGHLPGVPAYLQAALLWSTDAACWGPAQTLRTSMSGAPPRSPPLQCCAVLHRPVSPV